ncbi:hypothetical protein H0H92_001245, partial [Tricholoma furcatifolium]
TPTPTPTPTPFPSPTSPGMTGAAAQTQSLSFQQWMPAEHHNDDDADGQPSQRKTTAAHDVPPSPRSISSQTQSENENEHHPALAALSKSISTTNTSASNAPKSFGFGVLPYPEWRVEVTERAQRAGMGDVGSAMRWVKWGNRAQLKVDVDEVLLRHGHGPGKGDGG